jgi:hypothetical protein
MNYIVIVKPQTPISALHELELMASNKGAKIQHQYRHSVLGFSGTLPAELVDTIKNDPIVLTVELDQIVTATSL